MTTLHDHAHPDVTPTPASTPTGIQLSDTYTHPIQSHIPVIETHITTHSIIHVGSTTQNTSTVHISNITNTPSQPRHEWIKVENTDESKLLKGIWVISDAFVLTCYPVYCALMIFNTPAGNTLLNTDEYHLLTIMMIAIYGATVLCLFPRYLLGRNAFQFLCEVLLLMCGIIIIGDFVAKNGTDTLIGKIEVLGFIIPMVRVAASVVINMYKLVTADEPTKLNIEDCVDETLTPNTTGLNNESGTEYQLAIDNLIESIRQSSVERGELLTHEQLVTIATRMLRQHITNNVAGINNTNTAAIQRIDSNDNISYQLTESQEHELHHTLQQRFNAQNSVISPLHVHDNLLWRNDLQSPLPNHENWPQSLTPEQVKQLDAFELTQHDIDKNTDSVRNGCSICLCEYQINDTVKYLPCFHLLHGHCVDIWLQQKNLCPVCRAPALIYANDSNNDTDMEHSVELSVQ